MPDMFQPNGKLKRQPIPQVVGRNIFFAALLGEKALPENVINKIVSRSSYFCVLYCMKTIKIKLS